MDGTRLTYDLSDGEHLLGAAEKCDVLLEMAGVSRRQSTLTVSEGTLTVSDLDSKNGTFVNGRRIDSTMLSPAILYPTAQQQLDDFDVSGDLGLDTAVADLERKMIAAALARTKGNRSKAAKLLGISRNGLALKVDRLGLD